MEIVTWALVAIGGATVGYWGLRIAEWYWRGRPYSWDRTEDEEDEW